MKPFMLVASLWIAGCIGLLSAQIIGPILMNNTPSALPPSSGLLVWMSADVGANCGGPCTDGASQTSWFNRAGITDFNGVTDTSRALGGTVPNCVHAIYHTAQINGQPALTFNGNNSTPSCYAYSNATGPNLETTSTSFLVAKLASTAAVSGVQGGGLNWGMAFNNTLQYIAKACVVVIGAGTALPNTNWNQMNQTYDGTAWALRLNRASDGSGSNAQTIVNLQTGLGGNGCTSGVQQAFNGQIAEWIIYNRVLSGPEITIVETYLNGKYGL